MGNYITTYTGRHFYPAAPDPENICIEDIAHALPLICRGNGHVKTYWSVGQHCIACAREALGRGLSDRVALACLLHDASECYMSDIPRPYKKELPEYREMEKKLLDLIYGKFLGSVLTEEEKARVQAVDDALLWYDMKNLLEEIHDVPEEPLHFDLKYDFRPFAEVEAEYLALYREILDRGKERELRTERLLLRDYRPEDAPVLHERFGKDGKMFEYSGWNPYATEEMARETVQRFIDGRGSSDSYGWAVEHGGQFIGTVGAYDYHPEEESIELGISIDRDHWGKGFATEALRAMIGYLMEKRGIQCVKAWCASDNAGSARAMEKAGMTRTGVEPGGLKVGERTYDKWNYALRRKEPEKAQEKAPEDAQGKAPLHEECLICGAPLEYLLRDEVMECAVCGKKEKSRTRCVKGHYVCNACHMQGLDTILGICLGETSRNPWEIIEKMMAQPFCHMHGPEHHVMVGAALLTAYKNAGGDIDLKDALTEMMERGKSVPGGACGFWGACGAGISTGMFVSIVSGSTPLKNEPFALSHKMTEKALGAIGAVGGPRCCKRDSYLSILAAVDFAAEQLGVRMERPVIRCRHSAKNQQCIGGRCPFSAAYRGERAGS